MNRSGHAVAGAAVGSVAYLGFCKMADEQPTLGEFLVAIAAGAALACLPDVLEPAVHPNHRALVHSVALNFAAAAGLCQLWRRPDIESNQERLLTSLGLAFLTHPILDAMTPKGLPLLS